MVSEDQDRVLDAQTLRAQAAVLITQARGQIAEMLQVQGATPTGSALQSRLAAATAQTSAAIGMLSQSINAPGSTLRPSDLMALEGVVLSEDAIGLISEAKAQAAGAGATQSLAATSAATRQEVQTAATDIFDRKIFDPYLHFSSSEDEAAYRKHEDEDRLYVEQQLGLNTPEGDLNAGGGTMGQMLDAQTHGAGASPDFLPRWNALAQKVERQHAAMHAAGQSTEEFDRNMTASVRRFLKTRGLSEAEIDQRLAASADPLKAVEPFMKDDAASRDLKQLIGAASQKNAALPDTVTLALAAANDDEASPARLTIDFDAMNAKLQAAGVLMTGDAEPSGHGLAVPKPPGRPGLQVGG